MLYKVKDKNEIVYEIALADEPKATLIWFWGFPSYPKQSLLSDYLQDQGITICFPHYIGSWLSSGKFSPKNCRKTVSETYNFIKRGSATELYNNQEISWPTNNIILAGGSFGGYWALEAASQLDLEKYLLLAPFIDVKNHNKDGSEEDIDKTLAFARKAMSQVYSGIKDKSWDMFFKNCEIDYSKIKDKNILITHGKQDQSVKIEHSREAKKKLEDKNQVELIETDADHGIHKNEDLDLYRQIKKFILNHS